MPAPLVPASLPHPHLLPLRAAGWVVRKQLARALRQEGRVVEAIVQLMTAEEPGGGGSDGAQAPPPAKGSQGGPGGSGDIDTLSSSGVRGGVLYPDFLSLGQGADSWSAAAHWPAAAGEQQQRSLVGGLVARLVRRGARTGRALSRRLSATLRGSRGSVAGAAAAMGIAPELYGAVEPVYAMSGPTAASMQVGGQTGRGGAVTGRRRQGVTKASVASELD